MKILIISTSADPHRQAEALRAALGVTLRGAEVEVALMGGLAGALLTPLAQRSADTLRSFGHAVGPLEGAELVAAIARAGAVEVWT